MKVYEPLIMLVSDSVDPPAEERLTEKEEVQVLNQS